MLEFNDTVTSPLLVGEWKVLKVLPGGRTEVCKNGHMVRLRTKGLTKVPEPPNPTLIRQVAIELAYQFHCGGAPADDYMEAAEAVIRVVDDWRANP
jgi:hypothetical protein